MRAFGSGLERGARLRMGDGRKLRRLGVACR